MTADGHAVAVGAGLLAAGGVLTDSSGLAGIRGELAGRIAAVHAAVMTNWVQPATAKAGLSCPVDTFSRIGCEVVQVSFGKPCNADAASRSTIERAVRWASPLPFAGVEHAFQRWITLIFKYNGH